jgi:hypothetical protein
MPDTIGCMKALALAVLGSELGLSELFVSLVVALAFVVFAANSVMPHRHHDRASTWTGRDGSRHV